VLANAAHAAGYVLGIVVVLGFVFGIPTMLLVKRARRRHAAGKRWYL
jgi:hypothetical protein